jgi:murein DD-endopeptidase MepM/ murein hydrolase activator NlpD
MFEKAYRLALLLLGILTWSAIVIVAFFDNIDSLIQANLTKTDRGSEPPTVIASHPPDDPVYLIRTFLIDKSQNWLRVSIDFGLPKSFRKHLETSKLSNVAIPKGARLFVRQIDSKPKKPPIIGVIFPDLSVSMFKKNPGGSWFLTKFSHAESQKMSFSGVVSTTLFDSAKSENMDPDLLHQLSEAFAAQLDLNRNVRSGDQWRLIAKGLLVDGMLIGWDSILAAQYRAIDGTRTAIRYEAPGSSPSYYDLDGKSLKNGFLASPLRFSHITSGFLSQRFHPIHGTIKPHLGIDFSAPVGTPVMAIGDGEVSFVGAKKFSGKMIKLSHGLARESRYLHLSRFASRLHEGSKVSMGQIIGYVGRTGLATGPHLHFEFWVDDQVIDPQGANIAKARCLPDPLRKVYRLKVEEILASLPSWKESGSSTYRAASISSGPTLLTAVR